MRQAFAVPQLTSRGGGLAAVSEGLEYDGLAGGARGGHGGGGAVTVESGHCPVVWWSGYSVVAQHARLKSGSNNKPSRVSLRRQAQACQIRYLLRFYSQVKFEVPSLILLPSFVTVSTGLACRARFA
jgi:hypothetical protein